MNILFWNTYRNINAEKINSCLVELILDNNCDVILLAEYPDNLSDFCNQLNIISREPYKLIPNNSICTKIKGLIKSKYKITNLREQTRYQIFLINTVAYKLIVGAIHNVSKDHSTPDDQRPILTNMRTDIQMEENHFGIKNSIIIGDFNMNPFEKEFVAADTLFAVPYKSEVSKHTAIRNDILYEKFYNPSLKFLREDRNPIASYYCGNTGIVTYYWNMFDQAIIRPHLIDAFDYEKYQILSQTTNHNLISNNKPDKNNYSDHLPIFINLKEENIK